MDGIDENNLLVAVHNPFKLTNYYISVTVTQLTIQPVF